jgi:hypothetical protein
MAAATLRVGPPPDHARQRPDAPAASRSLPGAAKFTRSRNLFRARGGRDVLGIGYRCSPPTRMFLIHTFF